MDFGFFDTCLDAVLLVNAQGQIIYSNTSATVLFELSHRRLECQKPITEIIEFSDGLCIDPQFLLQTQEPSPYREVRFTSKSDKQGRVQLSVQKFSVLPNTDNAEAWLIYIRDVTLEETLQKKYRAELSQKEHVIEDLRKAQAQLEDYSRNLEAMVAARTAELQELNSMLTAMVDSLGQGFFVFDQQGQCLPIFSRACLDLLEASPQESSIEEMLKISDGQKADFKNWLTTLFAEMLPFTDLAPLGPQVFASSKGKHIVLEYHPMRDAQQNIQGIVVVATDKTNELEAQKEAERERANSQLILKMVKNKRQLMIFLEDFSQLLADFKKAIQYPDLQTSIDYDGLFRIMHTIKGGAASFAMKSLEEIAHQAEEVIQSARTQGYNLSQGGLGLALQQKYEGFVSAYESFKAEYATILNVQSGQETKHNLREATVDQVLEVLTKSQHWQLHEQFVNELYCEAVGEQFAHFDQVAQDLAQQCQKQLRPVQLVNADILVFAPAYSSLFASLIHCLRNSIDHGLETPQERVQSQKSESGVFCITFAKVTRKGAPHLRILLEDDGRGIDTVRLSSKLTQKFPELSLAKLASHRIQQFIFQSDLSTAATVTHLSGRGVGMDAVKHEAEKLGGKALVVSKPHLGTRVIVEVPFILPQRTASRLAA